jgi:NAD-dependent dihydropyrimidine dehydrogenase PreA subunit
MIELVLADRCNSCGKCEELCPTNVFDLDAGGKPVIARQEECHTCYLCEAHCPTDALYVGPLRTPQPVTREHVLSLGVLGNFRRALGFDKHEPGTWCYTGDETGANVEAGPATPRDPNGPNAGIYAALDIARQRGLVDVSKRTPIEREVIG